MDSLNITNTTQHNTFSYIHIYMYIPTPSFAHTSAPLSSSNETTAVWPAPLASWSGVLWTWRHVSEVYSECMLKLQYCPHTNPCVYIHVQCIYVCTIHVNVHVHVHVHFVLYSACNSFLAVPSFLILSFFNYVSVLYEIVHVYVYLCTENSQSKVNGVQYSITTEKWASHHGN